MTSYLTGCRTNPICKDLSKVRTIRFWQTGADFRTELEIGVSTNFRTDFPAIRTTCFDSGRWFRGRTDVRKLHFRRKWSNFLKGRSLERSICSKIDFQSRICWIGAIDSGKSRRSLFRRANENLHQSPKMEKMINLMPIYCANFAFKLLNDQNHYFH